MIEFVYLFLVVLVEFECICIVCCLFFEEGMLFCGLVFDVVLCLWQCCQGVGYWIGEVVSFDLVQFSVVLFLCECSYDLIEVVCFEFEWLVCVLGEGVYGLLLIDVDGYVVVVYGLL